MKNIKKILILLIILSMIIIVSIGILKKSLKTDPNLIPNEKEYDPDIILNEALERVSIRNNYYTVKTIIEEYYSCLCNLNSTNEEKEYLEENTQKIENSKNRIYSFFDDIYIKETGLSTDNIQEKLGNYKDIYVLINDMYVRDLTENLKVYFVFGNLTEKNNLKKEDFELMVAVDSNNSTFNIYTSDYIKTHNLYELSKTQDFKEKYFNIDNVENRKYNKYQFQIINDETYAKDLLKSYTQSIKYNNIDYSYDRLDEQYKKNKFKEKSYYEEYIRENKEKIAIATLEQYKIQKYEGYKQYICVDQRGNYYIFNENSVMNYTLLLDTYTVDLPEFLKKYNSSEDTDKVALNIEKIKEAIDCKDYQYVYNKLDDTFKNNKFQNYTNFEIYLKSNLFEENTFEYKNIEKQANVYVATLTIKNKKDANAEAKQMNIIMKLTDTTDYYMSFSFEK